MGNLYFPEMNSLNKDSCELDFEANNSSTWSSAVEGLIIFNRYFKTKLPNNIIGIILYIVMVKFNLIYRFVCKKIGFGIFSK